MQATPPKKAFVLARPPREALFRNEPEDFVVEELPAYLPSGEGEHLFIYFEKRNQTTTQAVASIARVLGVRDREVGVAGQKDKRAVTRQWISVAGVTLQELKSRTSHGDGKLEGIGILDAALHQNKLRTGHLKGNRFEIVLRETSLEDLDLDSFRRQVDVHGFGNFFGAQRFRDEALLARAIAWLREEVSPPRNKAKLKWWMSTIQSALFNRWLSERIDEGLLGSALPGDILKREDSGGLFDCDDAELDSQRAARWEVSPTGPIWGAKMRRAHEAEAERELRVLAEFGLQPSHFEHHKRAGAGTRRLARVRPHGLCHERMDATTVRLRFELPKGCYATELLRELLGQEVENAKKKPS